MEHIVSKHKCINCQNDALELHHVVPLALGGKDVVSNKVWLCSRCHAIVHGLNLEKRGTHWKQLQAAGIKKAQAKGVKFGRPRTQKPDNWTQVYESWGEKVKLLQQKLWN